MYQVQLVSSEHSQDAVGQVTVDAISNNGDVEVKLNSAIASKQLFLKFCQFGKVNQNCILVGSFNTDAIGNADSTLKFPQKGTFVGVFYVGPDSDVTNPSTNSYYQTEPDAYGGNFRSTQSYRVALQPENNVTGGLDGISTTAAPLTSGFVSETGTAVHAEIHGAKPNTKYMFTFCPNTIFGSGCNEFVGNSPNPNDSYRFTTDASGNGSIDVTAYSAPSEVFFVDVSDTRGQGYVTGFVVQ